MMMMMMVCRIWMPSSSCSSLHTYYYKYNQHRHPIAESRLRHGIVLLPGEFRRKETESPTTIRGEEDERDIIL